MTADSPSSGASAGSATALTAAERERYRRHLALTEVGAAGQQALKAARVLVIGAGGLGSPAALYLAAAGIGTLGILDCDRVEDTNLQRQVLFRTEDVGAPKAQAARQRLQALNPLIRVVAHQTELTAANVETLFAGYDVIVDGSDRIATRYLVNDACVIYGKSLVSAAIHRFEGQALTYVPERGPCYRCAFPDVDQAQAPSCAEVGVLGVLPGVLGSIQATEVIKLVLGIGEPLLGRLLTYDALSLHFHEYRVARRPDCAVCGQHPSIRVPQDAPGAGSPEELRQVRSIAARELEARLAHSPAPALIDVREPSEFAAGHLPRSLNIPLSELTRDATRLPREGSVVFVCRSGARSAQACVLARRAGVTDALTLAGGLTAWQAAHGASTIL